MSITNTKLYDPLHVLWLDIRNIISYYEYQAHDYIDIMQYECSKEDYDKFKNIMKDDENNKALKEYLGVDMVKIHSNGILYVSRYGTSTKIMCSLRTVKCHDTGNIKSYVFVINSHKERKAPLHAIFNFSSKKTGAENEYMYGPFFKTQMKSQILGKVGKYIIKGQEKLRMRNNRTEILQLSDDICSILDKYVPSDIDDELGHKGIIWDHDTIILDSFQDAYNLVHTIYYKPKYTILYWSKDSEDTLVNLYGHTGYTYFVMNNDELPSKIMSRYKELVKIGAKPVLPDDKTWKEQEFKKGPYNDYSVEDIVDEDNDDNDESSEYNYISDIEDPYFVQTVYEASVEDRMISGSCLIVKRVHNNYEYKIEQKDYTQYVKITKKYTMS